MALSLCPACTRHVRTEHTTCPFCGAERPPAATVAEAEPGRRLSRAALVFGVVAVSVSAQACGKETIAQPYGAPPTPADAGPPVETIAQPYGAPPTPPPVPPDAGAAGPKR
ncbi:MAG TPA: hypothetical protein PK141_28820 [Polyangiaceae bacterium]|nr:hypothetical protein [Polyangiaceae bacterium]